MSNNKELFRLSIPVRITDLNYGNHLGNDALVSILHESRAAWLKGYGLTELEAGGVGMIMTELHVVYKAEGFYGDELEIIISKHEHSSRGFTLHYLVSKHSNEKKITVAEATTKMLCYDYSLKKVAGLSAALRKALLVEP